MINRLKSIFVTALITYAFVVLAHSVFLFVGGKLEVAGLLLSNLLIVGYFAVLFLKPRARTSKGLHGITLAIIISVISGFYFDSHLQCNLLGVSSVLGWLVYVYWYSDLGNRVSNKLEVGSILPSFEIEDTSGTSIKVPDSLNKPLLILFYRANWCPLCMAQINEVADKYKEISESGTEVLLISPSTRKIH